MLRVVYNVNGVEELEGTLAIPGVVAVVVELAAPRVPPQDVRVLIFSLVQTIPERGTGYCKATYSRFS